MPDERCDECGFEYKAVEAGDAVVTLRTFPKRYTAPLTRLLPGEDVGLLRTRPEPDVWSALEYAAHVRDVFAGCADRVKRILAEDRPVFEPIRLDDLAVERRYNDQDPDVVTGELSANAEALALILVDVPDDGWDRVGLSRGEERTVLSTARRAVHEGHHHLLDIGRVLRHVRGR